MLAQAYYTLAVAYVYWAAEESCTDPLVQKKRALKNYQAARRVSQEYIYFLHFMDLTIIKTRRHSQILLSDISGDFKQSTTIVTAAGTNNVESRVEVKSPIMTENEERKELSDEIEETIVALKDEIVVCILNILCNNIV